MLTSTLRRILDTVARSERSGQEVDRYRFGPRERERIETLIKGGFLKAVDRDRRLLAITQKGDDARRPPLKRLRDAGWKPEPRGPGRAERRFADAEGERLELLAYTFLATDNPTRLCCGFEIFARDYRGQFYEQVAAGEASDLVEAKALAEEMIRRPRAEWRIEARSWVPSP
ncbi:hypothetical protein [Bradyrhizobium oligotrophicum]|uniref:hypothetical protein n=1 Tax=Bradyrhizobium oligotrophicum TaxID=44255 RepID=UPI003EBEFC2A